MIRPGGSIVVGLSILGKGEADQPAPELFDPKLRMVVRYADPAAWITAAAVARAVSPVRDRLATAGDEVGVLVVSDEGPQEAMAAVAEAALSGFSSPLRYPAANAGSLVGVTCILMGFRGPTLNIIMPPAQGVPVGLLLAAGWLRREVACCVVLSVCGRDPGNKLVARSVLLSAAEHSPSAAVTFDEVDDTWLRSVGV